MEKLTVKQKKVARFIQKDMRIRKFPFTEVGGLHYFAGREILEIIKQLIEKRFIRKFSAILGHQNAGFKENALVVWSVPVQQTEHVGNIFAAFPFISHCYEREPAFLDKYNIFTMLHSDGRSISSLIKEMLTAAELKDYLILKSVKEYKKTSPEYF